MTGAWHAPVDGGQGKALADNSTDGNPASAEAAYPLGERKALLMAPLSKVLLRYFWKK